MKIGKLNDLLSTLSCEIGYENSTRAPKAKQAGDPLRGEPLVYSWEEVRDTPLVLRLSLGETAFVDRVVLSLGEKTALVAATLSVGSAVVSEHRAETGRAITERTLELEVGLPADALTLSLVGDFSDVELLSLELYGAVGEDELLFPTPNRAELGEALLPHARFSTYSADSADGARAGAIFAERFSEITTVTPALSENGAVCFTVDASLPANGYTVTVSDERIELSASDLRGFVMAAETLLKLTDERGVRTAEISDAPAYPFRGVHLFLPSLQNMEFAKRLVKYLLSPMGYNAVIFEVATGMRYESHPEITEAALDAIERGNRGEWPTFPHGGVADGTALEKEDVRALVDYVRSFGIEVIPEVQSLGHVPYITLAHPEVAEVSEEMRNADLDTRLEDARPNVFYPHCYCPSNERSYEILFDLLDEVIEVFRPTEYVHMGHDEVYYMGVCPRCKGRSHAELYAADVNRIHAHLKEKGLKMMIWSDMLQPVTHYETPAAVTRIPKDIVMLDFIWYFHLDKDIEDNLLRDGFKVAVGNLYSSHFPRYESRIRKEGMIGGQISAWVSTSEAELQREGKLYDLFYTAEMLWSDSYSHLYRRVYERTISALMPALREHLKGMKYPSRRADAARFTLTENDPSASAETRACTVDVPCDSLVFTHAMRTRRMRLPWKKHDEIAVYRLSYSDGSEETVPVYAYGNIGAMHRRQYAPLSPKLYRHNGYAAVYESDGMLEYGEDGTARSYYGFEYVLPKGKRLVGVSLEENADCEVFLRRVEGVR